MTLLMYPQAGTHALDIVGAGHAHLFLLERLVQQQGAAVPGRLRVIAPSPYQYYSGMLPGLIAGHFTPEQCRIPVKDWALTAGAEWIEASLTGLDADQHCLQLSNGQSLNFDLVSLATGGVCDLTPFHVYQGRLLSVKPMEAFYDQWLAVQQALPESLAVVGGGAGGYELICAVAERWQQLGWHSKLYWVIGNGKMLAAFSNTVRRLAAKVLQRYGIEIVAGRAGAYEGGLQLSPDRQLPVDVVILATGSIAPSWVKASSLTTSRGFIEVDAYHRSVSHPAIFAAGDLCARPTTNLKASGVYAVRAGPILARNVLHSVSRTANGDTAIGLIPYHPQPRALYLLSCGRQQAIAHYGLFVAQGHWLWLCKRAIDLTFIKRFHLPNS